MPDLIKTEPFYPNPKPNMHQINAWAKEAQKRPCNGCYRHGGCRVECAAFKKYVGK